MRLIDADAFQKNIECCDIETSNDWYTIVEQLKEAPTVDAVILPCKVGDAVWVVFSNGIRPYVVDRIYIMGNSEIMVRMRFMLNEILRLTGDNFGKTVFLTREEAEAHLQKGKKNDEKDVCCSV